ncbi:MAG TPA: 3'-5' exonuclease, partial [Erysipelothrix sp.]|nr:3'-5' exonuclease [Erysipelothrix sp.]
DDVNRLFESAMNIYDQDTFNTKDISQIGTQVFDDTPIQNINTKNITSKVYTLDEDLYENASEATAYQIAKSIHTQYINNKDEMLDEYHSLDKIDDVKENYEHYTLDESTNQIQTKRPFMYKDIVVLVPTWGLLDDLKKAFEHYQIPSDIVSGKGFFQGEFIKGITAWYQYLLTHEKSYLIDILYNSCNLTYDEIIELNDINPNLLESLKLKDAHLGEALSQLLYDMRHMDANEVLSEIAQFEYTHNKGFRKEDLNNFDLLMTRIAHLSNAKPSISDFVVYLETITLREFQEESDKFPSAKLYSKNDDVVKVMTYHASKGLEFPVVYVWPYAKSKRPLSGNVFMHEDLGLIVRHIDQFRNTYKNIYYEMYETLYDKHILEEKIRLFYVAFTRAEYRAHVIEVIKPTQSDPELLYLNIPSYFNEEKEKVNNLLERFYLEKYKPSFLSIIFKDEYLEVSNLSEDIVVEKTESENDQAVISIFKAKNLNTKTFTEDKFGFNQHFIESTRYGNLMHDTLEKLIHYDVWDVALFETLNIDAKLHKRLLNFKNHAQTQTFLDKADYIEAEMPLLFLKDNEPTQNIIDLHVVKEDEVIIIDYKTDVEDVDDPSMINILKNRYTDQLTAYKKALEIEYPDKKIHAYVYSFMLEEYVEI